MSDDHFPLQAPAVNPRTVILIVLAVATALMVAVAVRLDRLSYHSYLQDLRLEHTVELMEAREEIEVVVFDHFLLLQRFSTYIRNNPMLTQEEFSNIAAMLHRAAPDVVNFAAETDRVIEYVHPFEENRSVLGLDYRHLPTQLPSVLKAIEERTGILSGPFDLVQGGKGLILRQPVFLEEEMGLEDSRLWGTVAIVVTLEGFVRQLREADAFEGFDTLIVSHDDTSGTSTVVTGDPAVADRDPVSLSFDFPNGNWQIMATPDGGWPLTTPNYVRDRTLMATAIVICLLVLWYILGLSEARRIARVRLSGAVRAMEDGFAVFGADGRMLKCNGRYLEILDTLADVIQPGVSLETILRQGLNRGLFADARGREIEWMDEQLQALSQPAVRREQRLSNGRFVKETLHRTDDGGWVSILADVTYLKDATEKAEAANEAKTQFISTLSHELRTPLTVILGLAQLTRQIDRHPTAEALLREIDEDSSDRESLRAAAANLLDHVRTVSDKQTRSGNHLLYLINEMLDFAKIEAGKLVVDMQPTPVDDILGAIEDQMRQAVEQKGLEFEVVSEGGTVLADRQRVHQILINLVGNALKFTDTGQITLAALRDGDNVRFSVTDTGPGIPADHRERIFNAFEQIDSSDTRDKAGTGLGLAISRELATAQSGSLDVDSAAGLGSTFTLSLRAGRLQ